MINNYELKKWQHPEFRQNKHQIRNNQSSTSLGDTSCIPCISITGYQGLNEYQGISAKSMVNISLPDPATESSSISCSHKWRRKSFLTYAMASLFFEQWSNLGFKLVYGFPAHYHRMKGIPQRNHYLEEKELFCVEADMIFHQSHVVPSCSSQIGYE